MTEELIGARVRVKESLRRTDIVGGQTTTIIDEHPKTNHAFTKYKCEVEVTYTDELKTAWLFEGQFEVIEQDEKKQRRSRHKRIANGQRDTIKPRI